jgi:hypothetical protein
MIFTSTYVNEMIAEKIKIGLIKDLRKATDEVMKVESAYDADIIVRLFMKKMNKYDIPDMTFGFYHRRLYVWHKSMDEVIKALEAVGYQNKKKTPRKFLIHRVLKLFQNLQYLHKGVLESWNYTAFKGKEDLAPDRLGPFNTRKDVEDWCARIHYSNGVFYQQKNGLMEMANKEIWHKPGMDDSIVQEAWNLMAAQEVMMA